MLEKECGPKCRSDTSVVGGGDGGVGQLQTKGMATIAAGVVGSVGRGL